MKILLTGHKGFIGSHALKRLESKHEVTAYDWDDGDCPGVMDYDWVWHIGAISATTERDINRVLKQNYDFTLRLYSACRTFGVGFQFSSSASVYGLGTNFSEDAPPDPRTPYAWSKYLCERYIDYRARAAPVQLFRYFNVYGPEGEEHKGSQASPHCQFTRQAQTTGEIRLFENSHLYKRDFIHVDKVLDVHEAMMDHPMAHGIFNVGTGETLSFQDIAEDIASKYHAKIVYIPMPDILKDSYQTYTCADMTKLNTVLQNI
jgi:ADP-L-glycero-D-manno-heptose 6-epimerase